MSGNGSPIFQHGEELAVCRTCEQAKPSTGFYSFHEKGTRYYFRDCRVCFNARRRVIRAERIAADKAALVGGPRFEADVHANRPLCEVVELNPRATSMTVSFTVPADASHPYFGVPPGGRATTGGEGRRPEPEYSIRQRAEVAAIREQLEANRLRLDEYGTADGCSRGRHPFHRETFCRGYDFLGCFGFPLHVHRRCLTHAVEVIEAAPATSKAARA